MELRPYRTVNWNISLLFTARLFSILMEGNKLMNARLHTLRVLLKLAQMAVKLLGVAVQRLGVAVEPAKMG